jgi:hypothetical protein
MRWKPDPKFNRLYDGSWHTVFAWAPLKVEGTWVWLERLQRRYRTGRWSGDEPLWDHRLMELVA